MLLWLPYLIHNLMFINNYQREDVIYTQAVEMVALFNSIVDPILFVAFRKDLKEELGRILNTNGNSNVRRVPNERGANWFQRDVLLKSTHIWPIILFLINWNYELSPQFTCLPFNHNPVRWSENRFLNLGGGFVWRLRSSNSLIFFVMLTSNCSFSTFWNGNISSLQILQKWCYLFSGSLSIS